MSTSQTAEPPVTSRAGQWRTRAVGAVATAAAALLVWLVAGPVAGVDFVVTRDGTSTEVGAGMVLAFSLGSGLAGWAFVAVLERITRRARAIWIGTASAVTVLSLVMPFNAGEISTSAIVSLLLMHVVVGAVLIPWYARTIR